MTVGGQASARRLPAGAQVEQKQARDARREPHGHSAGEEVGHERRRDVRSLVIAQQRTSRRIVPDDLSMHAAATDGGARSAGSARRRIRHGDREREGSEDRKRVVLRYGVAHERSLQYDRTTEGHRPKRGCRVNSISHSALTGFSRTQSKLAHGGDGGEGKRGDARGRDGGGGSGAQPTAATGGASAGTERRDDAADTRGDGAGGVHGRGERRTAAAVMSSHSTSRSDS